MSTFDQLGRRVIVEADIGSLGITPQFVFEQWLKSRYEQVLNTTSIGNLARHVETRLFTTAPYVTGTVSVNKGTTTVTGVGTTFVAGHVGQQFRIAAVDGWYNVASVTDATHLELEIGYGGANVAGAAYYIAQPKFTLGDSIKWITEVHVVGETSMTEHTQDTLLELYADRPSVPATPTIWSPIWLNSVYRSIELYPVPDAIYLISINGFANINAPAFTGSPTFDMDERVLLEGAIADGLMYKAVKDNSLDANTRQLIAAVSERHEARFAQLRDIVQRRDAAWV